MGALLGFLELGPGGMLIVGVLAVLLFGERLPEVGRSFGKKFMELKKNFQGIEQELSSLSRDVTSSISGSSSSYGSSPSNSSANTSSSSARSNVDDYTAATAPKFEPPPAEPHSGSSGG